MSLVLLQVNSTAPVLHEAAEEPKRECLEHRSSIIAGREVNSTAFMPNAAVAEPQSEGVFFPVQAKLRVQQKRGGGTQKQQKRGDQAQKSLSPTAFKDFQAHLQRLCGRKEREPTMQKPQKPQAENLEENPKDRAQRAKKARQERRKPSKPELQRSQRLLRLRLEKFLQVQGRDRPSKLKTRYLEKAGRFAPDVQKLLQSIREELAYLRKRHAERRAARRPTLYWRCPTPHSSPASPRMEKLRIILKMLLRAKRIARCTQYSQTWGEKNRAPIKERHLSTESSAADELLVDTELAKKQTARTTLAEVQATHESWWSEHCDEGKTQPVKEIVEEVIPGVLDVEDEESPPSQPDEFSNRRTSLVLSLRRSSLKKW